MNAVNLIPAGERRRRGNVATGLPFLGLLGGLVVVLVATVLFVLAHNRVDSKQSQLAAIQASSARWSAAAATYAHAETVAKQRETTIAGVESLVVQRANWSQLLGQVAAVMPAHSQITSLTASAAAPTATTGTTGTTGTTTTGTTTPASAASAASATGAASSSAPIQLAACAGSQSVVAQTLIALRRVTGVSDVTLGSSSSSASGASASGASGSGACSYPVSFSVTLAFAAPTTSSAGLVTGQPASATSSTNGSSGVSQ